MVTTWWFEVTDEDSENCGEEFFVEVDTTLDKAKREAMMIAGINFPATELTCWGRVSEVEAEIMGLDTY